MKKILFWSAVTILAAVSCNKIEDEVPATQSNVPSFVASVDGAETKTVIEGMKSYWNGTEGIRVLDGVLPNGKVYTATVEPMAQTATFTEVDNTSLEDGVDYLAVYPEGPAGSVTWDGGDIINLYLKDIQTLINGSYDPDCHIAVATANSENLSLEFKNAVALVKFQLQGDVDKVSEVCFYTKGGEKISGNFNLSYNNHNPLVTGVSEDKKEYSYPYVKVQGEFKEETDYYLVVLPGTYGSGFGVEALTSGVKCTKEMSKEYTLSRNQILDLGTLTATAPVSEGSGWYLPGGHNSWNAAEDELFEEGDYYVVKDITPTAEGFKFFSNGTWKGISTSSIAVDTWTSIGGSNNIKVSVLQSYDIYMTKDALQCYITQAGNTAPEAPSSPYKTIYLDVTKNWSDSTPKFDAWIWGAGDQWVDFVQIGDTKIYKVEVPKGTTGMKIMRRGVSQTSHSWDDKQKWNTTGDITLGNNNLITITGWDNSFTLGTYAN